MRPLNRFNIQYGWYVLINRKKADFGGSCIPLNESKQMALDFILKIKEISQQRDQIAGTPTNDIVPFTNGNISEEHG